MRKYLSAASERTDRRGCSRPGRTPHRHDLESEEEDDQVLRSGEEHHAGGGQQHQG